MRVTHKTPSTTSNTIRRAEWNEEHEIEGGATFTDTVVEAPGAQATGKVQVTLPGGATVWVLLTSPDE